MDKKDLPGYDRQTMPPSGAPYGWIQWKGTTVCMDVHCSCGHMGHVDAEFCYYVKCGKCGQVYLCNQHVELVTLTPEEQEREADIAATVVVTDAPDVF